MYSRRKFLTRSALGSIAITMGQSCAKGESTVPTQFDGFTPRVIATWKPNLPACKEAWQVIVNDGKAIDAVEAGVKIPEANPNDQSVGYGGRPDREGNVTLDACIMDEKGNCGAVTYLQKIKHPISVARKVMDETPHVMLSGDGALKFALENGFVEENLLTEASKKDWEEWLKEKKYKPVINVENHDTIGMIAMDKNGDLSGACTTSGAAFKMQGRVGDSPIIGAGLYVDNEVGGAAATGLGEEVIKMCGSFLVVELMRQGKSPQEACEAAVQRIAKKAKKLDFQVGFIAMSKKGEIGAYSVQPGFGYAIQDEEKGEVVQANSHFKSK